MGNQESQQQQQQPINSTVMYNNNNRTMGDALGQTNTEINNLRKQIEILDKKRDIMKRDIMTTALTDKRRALELVGDLKIIDKERETLQKNVRLLSNNVNQVNSLKTTVTTQRCVSALNGLTKDLMSEIGLDEMEEIAEEASETRDGFDRLNYFMNRGNVTEQESDRENENLLDEIMNQGQSNVYMYPENHHSTVTATTSPYKTTTTTTTPSQQQRTKASAFADIYAF